MPAIVAPLADDRLGARRELDDMAPCEAAFDRIAGEQGTRVTIGVDTTGSVRTTCQITLISGLSLAATRRAQIESTRVARDLRGQGAGRAMFADADARAREAGCGLIQRTMNAARTESRKLHGSLGYEARHVGFKRYLD